VIAVRPAPKRSNKFVAPIQERATNVRLLLKIITHQGTDAPSYKAFASMVIQLSPVLPPLPPEEYEALKADIAHNGVQQQILVTSSGVIIDGNERFRAVTELGIRKYPIRVVGNISENERREMAISLNFLRRHFTHSERQHWLEELILLNPQISSRDLAAKAKVSQSTAVRAKAKVLGNESTDSVEVTGHNGKTYHYKPKPAVSVENPQSAKKAATLLESLGDRAPEGGVTMRKLRRTAYDTKLQAEMNSPIYQTPANIVIKEGDFRSINWTPWEGKASLIVADPPWLNDHADLREPLAKLCARLLRPHGVCLVYCGQFHLPAFVEAFGKHLTWTWEIACVNEDNGGAMRDAGNFHTSWRPVLVYTMSGFKNSNTVYDVVRTKRREKDLHPWQSPLSEAEYFVQTLSRPGDLIIDPCIGSGTVATAVTIIGQGRRFVGCDVNPACVRIASRRVAECVSVRTQAQP
jgi:DNA methylase/ParB-like nuclease domain